MAATRAALAEKLEQLEETVLGYPPTPKKRGTKTMATKKAAASHRSGAKPAPGKTKPTGASSKKTPAKKSARRATKKRRTPSMATQAKKVLGRVLASAAAGAVEGAVGGAVEAVAPITDEAAGKLRKKQAPSK